MIHPSHICASVVLVTHADMRLCLARALRDVLTHHYTLHAARRTLHAARRTLHAARHRHAPYAIAALRTPYAACCTPYPTRCTLSPHAAFLTPSPHAACRMPHAIAARRTPLPHAACCTPYAIVACCTSSPHTVIAHHLPHVLRHKPHAKRRIDHKQIDAQLLVYSCACWSIKSVVLLHCCCLHTRRNVLRRALASG